MATIKELSRRHIVDPPLSMPNGTLYCEAWGGSLAWGGVVATGLASGGGALG